MEKTCAHCNESLDISSFHKHKQTKDGLGSWCKKCLKERAILKRREQGIQPKRVGTDPVKRQISNLNYRNRKAETFVYTITEKVCSRCDVRSEEHTSELQSH